MWRTKPKTKVVLNMIFRYDQDMCLSSRARVCVCGCIYWSIDVHACIYLSQLSRWNVFMSMGCGFWSTYIWQYHMNLNYRGCYNRSPAVRFHHHHTRRCHRKSSKIIITYLIYWSDFLHFSTRVFANTLLRARYFDLFDFIFGCTVGPPSSATLSIHFFSSGSCV